MEKYNIEKYFENSDNEYYNSKFIITILEDVLGKNTEIIKKELSELKIVVTIEQIKEYLNNKFEEENPIVKARLENPKPRKPLSKEICFGKLTDEEIEESSQHFADQITASRYAFDSFTLEYFNKYSNIVRNKANKILNIIEKISDKEYSTISDLLAELDIRLDANGNITKEDVIRLVVPFVHNYNELTEKVSKANNLETYLTFILSKHSLYRSGCSEGELYPTTSIQTKSLFYDGLKGNIPLSDKQRRLLREEQRKGTKKFIKDLLNW